ncbi:MAG: NAD(P)H-dependent oxidoreductase [Proteobacteria bacterium]|nr:MAG: NAD(P)H-dependent oxidoreductase [Pseudomonadota bacterium]
MSIIDLLQWRYAAKKMTGQKVPQESVDRILEAARLAPTSSGLQPFEIIVVSNEELKNKIKAISMNQSVVTECSHLLIFAAWDTYTAERINMMFDLVNSVRGIKNEGFENYRNYLLNVYPPRDPEIKFQHAARQAYIGFSMAMAQAAEEKVDCTPMEGFDPAALDELLNLKSMGLRSAVMLPLGYRDETGDWNLKNIKVRQPREKFIRELK